MPALCTVPQVDHPSFARQIARIEAGQQAPVIKVGALDRWRDLLDVRDVCAAYAAALNADITPGAIYNIASGAPRRTCTAGPA